MFILCSFVCTEASHVTLLLPCSHASSHCWNETFFKLLMPSYCTQQLYAIMAQCCPALPHGRFWTRTRRRPCWSLPCLVTLRFATCWALSNWPGVGACCSPLGYCIVDKSEPQLAFNIIQHLFHSDLSLKVQECQDIDIKHPHTHRYIYIYIYIYILYYILYIYHCFIYNWAWVKSFLPTSSNITLIILSQRSARRPAPVKAGGTFVTKSIR